MAKVWRAFLVVLAIVVTITSFINVMGDDTAVRAEAEGVACPRGCPKATSVKIERSPVAETVEYLTPEGSIKVSCMRAALLVGPYSCTRQ